MMLSQASRCLCQWQMWWAPNSWTITPRMDLFRPRATASHMLRAVAAWLIEPQTLRAMVHPPHVSATPGYDPSTFAEDQRFSDIWRDGLHPMWATDKFWAEDIYNELSTAEEKPETPGSISSSRRETHRHFAKQWLTPLLVVVVNGRFNDLFI
jgi:hypothetical protein